MRSLFLKIFLSYWAAQALFVVLAILVTTAMRPQDSPRFEYFRVSTATQAAQAYERGGQAELSKYFEELQKYLRLHAFLFDDSGKEISGRDTPDWARQLAQGVHTKPGGFWLASDRRAAQLITGATGKHYVLVLERSVGQQRFLLFPSRAPGLGLLIGILSSGLVCFLLARYLTSPIVRLRAATQRLAQGDLTARAGAVGSHRGDEIAQLVRDFDSMAGRLENLVNAQSRLLNDISHELRSPLARLSVALGLVRQRTGAEARSTLDRIELEVGRLNELIGKLLVLARMEGGEPFSEKSLIHLEELVREIIRDADFEAQGRNCRIKYEVIDNCELSGNPALLHSAIENVVRNAMRYTHEGTEVEVRLERIDVANGPEAVIRVTDQGPGVPEDSLSKLFRPFYRLDDARERQTGGVGLGLAITERAVRLHGGSVRAANRPGGGLVVEIWLPLSTRPVAVEPPAHELSVSKSS